MIARRQYQSDAIAAVAKGWSHFNRQLLVLPTGGGKTVVFSLIAQDRVAQGQRTLILAHREELVDQAIEKLYRSTGIGAGKEKAEHWASPTDKVVVASVQTLIRRLDRWPSDHFGLVVADEAHHAISDSWQKVLGHFSDANVLGVTATPDRGDKRCLGEYFENVAYEVSLFELINAGFLSPIAIKSIPIKIDLSKVSSTAGDFDSSDLDAALEPYLEEIANGIIHHASFRRTLVFLPLRKTSRMMQEICQRLGLSAAHVDGESPDRREILADFAAGKYDILCNAMLLTEGFDDPGIDCIVPLRPTRSRSLYAQIVGRGTRVAEGKSELLLLDFLWMHTKHKICRPASLIASNEEEAEQITDKLEAKAGGQQELDLQDAAIECQHDRETALAKRIKALENRKATIMSAEEFAAKHKNLALAEYEPQMKWESEGITEKQLKVLQRAHIDPETVLGKGHASKIIDVIFRAQKITIASHAQRAALARMGHPSPHTATEAEARQFFAGLRNKVTA